MVVVLNELKWIKDVLVIMGICFYIVDNYVFYKRKEICGIVLLFYKGWYISKDFMCELDIYNG